LAEAALIWADNMVRHLANNWRQLTSLGPLLSLYSDLNTATSEAIDQAERGENLGKMILLLAYMADVKREVYSGIPLGAVLWGYGCSLVNFLKELTGDTFCCKVLISARQY
jgi:hypothetical protein